MERTEIQAIAAVLGTLVLAIITLIAAFYADKLAFEERLNKAYRDGVARAEEKAAAVGGWDNWVAAELEKN